MSYLYSLRLALDPGWTDERGLADLPRFIEAARIDDVMVFANVEELNTGHTDDLERAVYRDLAERTAGVAATAGASMSLNPWHTVMHGDYGRKLRAGQDFRLMVDPDGRSAQLAVCPRDEHWRRYLADLYAFYAAARPRFIWVEDDFRYHNHWPLEWGGCFCEEHLAEFSRRAGRPLTRQEFVEGLLRPGEPHPFRTIWLETAREALETAAAAVADAVRGVSAETRVGLMTSVPLVHAAEGRRWEPLLRAFSGQRPPAVRVHLPAYADRRPADYLALFHTVSDAHRALLPADAEVYPELENFPYSRFAKSRSFLRFQLLGAQVLAPDGMTIDLFDLNGNGPVWDEGYQDVLAGTRDYLDRGLASGVFRRPRSGVAVLISEDSATFLHTAAGGSMTGLYPREYLFGALLGGYGIPFRYTTDTTISGQVVAVSGQLFRTLGEDATRRLFATNRVVVDAEAVDTLVDMGLGDLVAARSVRWQGSEDGVATYEEAVGGVELLDRAGARASVLLMGAGIGLVDYDAGRARPLTRFFRQGHVDAGAGHVLVDDRVLVVPFGRMDPLEPPPVMLRTTLRQQLLQEVVSAWAPRLPLLVGAPDVAVYAYPGPEELSLYLVNGSFDALRAPRLVVGDLPVTAVEADPSTGAPGAVGFTLAGDGLVLDLELAPLESVLVRLSIAG
ncbi:MAG: hypothetical protein AAGC63_15280 [Propionicimonas sp.]|nr:hypothetical protein [Propionicimonas sp.]